PIKDPKGHFKFLVEYFTKQRLEHKQKGKETGESYYKDLEQMEKIVINSFYGMLAAKVLFNSPSKASFVTAKGREILNTAIQWAEQKGFTVSNADTDSISFTVNGEELSKEQRQELLKDLNS